MCFRSAIGHPAYQRYQHRLSKNNIDRPLTITVLVCLQEQLDSLKLQLEERHQQELEQLRSSMALTYKEELLQARTELTDRYYKDIDQLNTKHAHELEQLRAKLSDNHIKGKALRFQLIVLITIANILIVKYLF